jgi:tripartite-type tricarboxylate transporter receptor subunit TctC
VAPAVASVLKPWRCSAPDGYTLLVGSNGPLTVNPFVQAKLGYDPLKDFAPVALTSYVPHVIILNSKVDAKNIAELMLLSKKAQISIATSGVGSATHMTLERFKAATSANIVHVPYRSGGALKSAGSNCSLMHYKWRWSS